MLVPDLTHGTMVLPFHYLGETQLLKSFKGKTSSHHGFLLVITLPKPWHTISNDDPVIRAIVPCSHCPYKRYNFPEIYFLSLPDEFFWTKLLPAVSSKFVLNVDATEWPSD